MSDTIAGRFARWAARLSYEDLPPEVVDKLQAFILHALTASVFGAKTEHGKEAIALTKVEEARPDGATILADGSTATRSGAAFAGSELVHTSGLWDSYRMLTHPGCVLVPAALGTAELERRSGRDLITALAAGYEFMFRLCDDFIPSTAARGFRPSPLYSTMGAALACGKLVGLSEDGLVSTIAVAANFASGLNEGPRTGSGEMAIHEPQAARNGAFAAVIARSGHLRGAESSIEGEAGFYNAFTGTNSGALSYAFTGPLTIDLASITEGLGTRYTLLTAMFRMYPVAGYNQPVIDLMVEMRQRYRIDPDEVAQIAVAMNWIETLYPSPAFPRYPDWNTPRVGTTHYFVAHAAVNGGFPVVGGRTFGPTGARLAEDERVLAFMRDKVTLVQEKDRPMFSPAITVTMQDGRTFRDEYPYARMEWNFAQLVERLQDCLPGFPLGRPGFDALTETVRDAAALDSVAPLLRATLVR